MNPVEAAREKMTKQIAADLRACELHGRATVLEDVKELWRRVRATPDTSPGAIRAIQAGLMDIISKHSPPGVIVIVATGGPDQEAVVASSDRLE